MALGCPAPGAVVSSRGVGSAASIDARPSEASKNWPVVERWGRLAYAAALERQLALAGAVAADERRDTIVAVEHPPTITLGRHATTADVLAGEAERHARGIEFVRTDRGGKATYHGPGQAVIYPIVGIARLGLGPRRWVCLLESALHEALAGYGLRAELDASRPGVWVGGAKVASIGLRIVRGVSYHGVSLNVGLDVSGFGCIVPCGSVGERITSLGAECASPPSLEQASESLIEAIAERLRAEAAAKGTAP
jgi:lipoyl(octanoyl) transferase